MIVHFFDVLNCCNEERCQIIIYILSIAWGCRDTAPWITNVKKDDNGVIWLRCCISNVVQSAWRGSWPSWHVTARSWLTSQSISGHGLWSETEGGDNSRRVNTDYWGRGDYYNHWGLTDTQALLCESQTRIETSRRIKGPPYLRSKPRASEDLFWLDWVFASEQSELVMAGSDRVLTGDSFRFRRDFGFSAVWIPCPMSGDSRWEEGRK